MRILAASCVLLAFLGLLLGGCFGGTGGAGEPAPTGHGSPAATPSPSGATPGPTPTGPRSTPSPSPSASPPVTHQGQHVTYTVNATSASLYCRCAESTGPDEVSWGSPGGAAKARGGISPDAQGSVTVRILDASGMNLFTRTLDGSSRSFDATTLPGAAGTWQIEADFAAFSGDFSLTVAVS